MLTLQLTDPTVTIHFGRDLVCEFTIDKFILEESQDAAPEISVTAEASKLPDQFRLYILNMAEKPTDLWVTGHYTDIAIQACRLIFSSEKWEADDGTTFVLKFTAEDFRIHR